jgi:two-component system, LytTR family, response regulator
LRVAALLDEASRPEIIFITAFEHYAADAFTVEAADYLLKPVQFDRLWQAIERAKRRQYLRSLAEEAKAPAESSPPTEESRVDGIWRRRAAGRCSSTRHRSIGWKHSATM